jgi:23S rRNA G2445 N2-methylase RlmL
VRFFATCSKGTEGALRQELAALKLPAVRGGRGGVHFEGRLEHGAKACLHSRTAMRVLLELAEFPVGGADDLYEGAASTGPPGSPPRPPWRWRPPGSPPASPTPASPRSR